MRKIISTVLVVTSIMVTETTSAQIFYKVEGNGAPAPSYVFGSHHLSPIDIVEESGAMEYFNQADQIIGEIDLTIDQMTISMALQPHMMAPADSTLSVLLAGQDMDVLNAQFQKWSPMEGLTLQMLEPMKPMAVNTMVAVGMSAQVMPGFDPNQQLDSYFFKEGQKQGKKIVALETPEYQGTVLFDMTPLTVQAEGLIDILTHPDEAVENAKKLSKAYQSRDLESMYEVAKQTDEHPEFMENILFNRNANWMTRLPELIEETPSFIVVGALHLAGPEGILQGLQDKGFVVTPIY